LVELISGAAKCKSAPFHRCEDDGSSSAEASANAHAGAPHVVGLWLRRR